jgi:hypothetical protein
VIWTTEHFTENATEPLGFFRRARPNRHIGLIYRDRNDDDHAIHWLTRALQANPLDVDAQRILAKLKAKG